MRSELTRREIRRDYLLRSSHRINAGILYLLIAVRVAIMRLLSKHYMRCRLMRYENDSS